MISQEDAAAEGLLQDFTSRFGPATRELARYASLPVVLTPDLINLLHVNFQPDVSTDSDPGIVSGLLLSDICTELGDDMYEMDPNVRRRLLVELLRDHGESTLQEVAMLLWEYSKRFLSWSGKKNLQWAQQLSALNFIDPEHAQRWLDAAEHQSTINQGLDRKWFVAMRKELADKRVTVEGARKKIEDESRSRLAQALVSALTELPYSPVQVMLEQLSRYLTGDRLNEDIRASSLEEGVERLVIWAETHEKRTELIRLALTLNPNNQQLQAQAREAGLDPTFDRAEALVDQAKLMQNEGNLAAAQLLLTNASTIREAELGSGHVDTLNTVYELGLLLETMEQYDEASSLFQHTWSTAHQSLGEAHPLTQLLADKLPKSEPTPVPPGPQQEPNTSGTDRFDKFTERARTVLQLAWQEALNFNHDKMGTEHILLGLVREGDGVAARVLNNLGIELEKVRSTVELIMGLGAQAVQGDQIGLSPRSKRVIELAVDEARRLKHHYIGTEHLLLGLVREDEGIAVAILESLGVPLEKVRAQVLDMLKSSSGYASGSIASRTPNLDTLSNDLTALASTDKLTLVIGRNREIDRALQILSRRNKNSLVLVGERRTGKTSIVHGLAQRMISRDVPETLYGRRIISIDMNALDVRSENQSRTEQDLQRAIAELTSEASILFVDDLRTLFGPSAIRYSNLVKLAVSRGEIQLISTATPEEFDRFILQGDPALERQIQQLPVAEPSQEETLDILRGTIDQYEEHHGLKITDDALKAAVTLSARYVTDRPLPDKAVDLIDEASSRVRLYRSRYPSNLSQLVQELDAISREKNLLVASEDYERAADLREREWDLRKHIQRLHEYLPAEDEKEILYVTEEDVAQVVSIWTGIRAEDMLHQEVAELTGGADILEYGPGVEQSSGTSETTETTSLASSDDTRHVLYPLTLAELRVLALMVRGMTDKEIAQRLLITVNTVRYHVRNIMVKLGARNRVQAATIALRQNLLENQPDT